LNDPERILDIGVAKALDIQFRSGYNILKFYSLREKMFRIEGQERLEILKQLTDIINKNGMQYIVVQIPFNRFLWSEEEFHPIRIDVRADESSWCPNNPITSRLMLGNDNPADLGWLIFD